MVRVAQGGLGQQPVEHELLHYVASGLDEGEASLVHREGASLQAAVTLTWP